ncbi:MAG: carbohydrate kinase [Chloroflexi bacterium AL-N5]|nr:carbohydrate kinase [Chloroflexi bacterium AL-N5]
MKIVCMGDALIDFKEQRPLNFQGFVGGSPLNVAVAAARLGEDVSFASQVSSDQFGKAIRNYLQANEVDTSYLLESDAPSTLAFVGEVAGEAVFDFIANRSADVLYNPEPRPSFPSSVRMLQFGSISLLQEPAATTLTDIAALHHERCTIVFDPNVRPTLIASKGDYEARLRRDWLPISHIVKVSSQDLRWLYPERSLNEIAKDWLEHGPEVIIITQGENGVSLFRPQQPVLHVSVPAVDVVDTVGAGDTFTGALMVMLEEQAMAQPYHEIPETFWTSVLQFAGYAAACNCTRAGANPPTRGELATFMRGNQ